MILFEEHKTYRASEVYLFEDRDLDEEDYELWIQKEYDHVPWFFQVHGRYALTKELFIIDAYE